jgi:phosphohistidine swiveling domain-containing protein
MNQNLFKQLNREWQKSSTRRMSYQKMRLYSYGVCQGYRKVFGLGHHFYLNRVKDGVDWSYVLKDEADKWNVFLKKKLSDKKYLISGLSGLVRRMECDYEAALAEIKKFRQNWEGADNKDLLAAFKYYQKFDNRLGVFHWILFDGFEKPITEALRMELAEIGLGGEEISRLISVHSQPWLVTPIDMERLSLLKIALLDKEKQEKALIKHHEEFAYMPMYDIDYEEYSLDHFRKELIKANRIPEAKTKEEIKKILEKYSSRKKQSNNLLKRFKDDKEVYGLMKFFLFFAAFKDYKPYVRDRISYCVRNLFREIAKRINLSLTETLFLTEAELGQALKNELKISDKEIKARVKNSAYFLSDVGKTAIFTEEEDLKIIDGILEGRKEKEQVIKGVSVFPGKAKGQAALILSNADFGKFSLGQILVTSATRPDFIPLMKKAAAIVADEGGLLSHAAIVSRELGIPCVVGTKIATQVLKDGDFVDVDADSGVVKIVKRN